MATGTPLNQIVKSLAFGVEAVPQDASSGVIGTSKDMPLNVKVKVRKKEESNLRQGFLSVPRMNNPDKPPERIRLISSDQTIMSFNMVMEGADFPKKSKKRPRIFFGGCLGTKHDDDEYAYAPKTKTMLKSDGEHKKSIIIISKVNDNSTGIVKPYGRDFGILGKCRPGGCLDPPFSEDKYQYAPSKKEESFPAKTTTAAKIEELTKVLNIDAKPNSVTDEQKKNYNNKPKNTKEKGKDISIVNLYEAETMKDSIHSKYSDSIITYPPVESSSTNLIGKNTRGRISSEEKQRKSNDESIVSFFKPTNRLRESIHERESKDNKKYKKIKDTNWGKDAPQNEDIKKVTPKDMIENDVQINIPSTKQKLALQQENSFVSFKSKDTVVSNDTNEKTVLLKSEDEMLSKQTKDATILQINKNKMDLQSRKDEIVHASQDQIVPQETKNEINKQRYKDEIVSQEPKQTLNYTQNGAEIVVHASQDGMVTQKTKHEMDTQINKDEKDSNRTKDGFIFQENQDSMTSQRSNNRIALQESKGTTVSQAIKDRMISQESKDGPISYEAKRGNSKKTNGAIFQQKNKDELDSQKTNDGVNSQGNKDEINSKGTQYEIITQEYKGTMIQQETKDGMYLQGTGDEIISQKSNNELNLQKTKDAIDESKDIMISQIDDGTDYVESENSMMYQKTKDGIVLKESKERMFFYEMKYEIDSQESESPKINRETKLDLNSQNSINEIVCQENKKPMISPRTQQDIVHGNTANEINQINNNYSNLEQNIWQEIENVVTNERNLDTQHENDDEAIKQDSLRFDVSKNSKNSEKSNGNEINSNKVRSNNQGSKSTESVLVQNIPDLSQDYKNIYSQYMPSLDIPNSNNISLIHIDNQILAPETHRHGSKSSLKKDTIILDFGFQSYVTGDKGKVIKTIETSKEPVRYPDDYVTFIKTQIKPNNNEIKISVDLENEMFIQFKRNKSPQRVHISDKKRNRYTIPESEPQNIENASVFNSISKSKIVNPEMLNIIYEKGLLPLHKSIQGLKKEIDALTKQQTVFKEKLVDPKRKKSYRILGINHNCSCKRH